MGHNEEPAPCLASAGFERAEQARFDRKAQLTKVPEDCIGSQGHVSLDIFEETPFGVEVPDDAPEVRPEVAGIVVAETLSGKAEGLAGITASEDMNPSTPRQAVEGGNVVPDRSLIQRRVCHPRHESGRGEDLPLDVTNSSISGLCDVQAEFKASNAGAEGNSIKAMGGM